MGSYPTGVVKVRLELVGAACALAHKWLLPSQTSCACGACLGLLSGTVQVCSQSPIAVPAPGGGKAAGKGASVCPEALLLPTALPAQQLKPCTNAHIDVWTPAEEQAPRSGLHSVLLRYLASTSLGLGWVGFLPLAFFVLL